MISKLTTSQQALWFAHCTDPGSATFQCGELIDCGHVDPQVLASAIRETLLGVEQLTGRFVEGDDGQPQLIACPTPTIAVTIEDAPVEDPHTWAKEFIHLSFSTTTPLSGPVLTAHAIGRDAEGITWWVARFHHIAADGFAIHGLLRHIIAVTAGKARPDELAVTSQQEALAEPLPASYESAKKFWEESRHLPQPQALIPPGEDLLYACATITADTRKALQKKAAEHTTSELHFLAYLVADYATFVTGTTATTIGLPCMNRPLGRKDFSVTPEVSVAPVPFDATADLSTFIRSLDDARAASSVRSEEIRRIRHMSPEQLLSGISVNLRPFSPVITSGEITARWHTISVGPVNDVEVIFQITPQSGFELMLFGHGPKDYQTKLSAHALRLASYLDRVAQGAGKEILDKQEFELVTCTFNSTSCDLAVPGTLAEMLAVQRRKAKGNATIALQGRGFALSFDDLWNRVDTMAAGLKSRGVGPSDLVAVHLPRGLDQVLAIAAAVRIGAAWLPISAHLPAQRVTTMLEIAQPALLIDSPLEAAPHAVDSFTYPEPKDLAYVLFTSGSTGAPKAVGVTQEGIVNRLEWMVRDLSITPTDRVMLKTSCSFDVSVWEYLLCFTHGIPVVVATDEIHRNPPALAEEMRDFCVTIAHFVPSALKAFLLVAGTQRLRTIICSGEALPAPTAQAAQDQLGVEVFNLYGPTEAAIDVTAHHVGNESVIPIGTPVANTTCLVLDHHLRAVPVGTPGTLYLGGVQLARGYVGRDDLTSERFITHTVGNQRMRLYNTGDIVHWDEQGVLYYHGRADSQIKLRGQRLELGEIEAHILDHPDVSTAAVAVKDIAGDVAIVAYLVGTIPADLSSYLAARLPSYMLPRFYETVTCLPTTINGKLDAIQLPTPQPRESVVDAPNAFSTTNCELCQEVTALFSELLGAPATPATNFFASGGTSLSAVTLLVSLKKLIPGITLPDIFAHATPAALASTSPLNEKDPAYARMLCLNEGSETGIPVFCLYPAGGIGWAYTALIPHLSPDHPLWAIQSPGLRESIPSSLDDAATIAVADIVNTLDGRTECDLVGWSLGGVLAHEVSIRLREAGIMARRLCMLDSYPASVWRAQAPPNQQELLTGILNLAGITHPGGQLSKLQIVDLLHSKAGFFSNLDITKVDRITSIIEASAHMMRSHDNRQYHGAATIIAAGKNPTAPNPQEWSTLVDSLDVITLDVNHAEMVSPAALAVVGKILA